MTESVRVYIERIKAALGVKTDEEAAIALGISKQAIANWRKREKIPLETEFKLVRMFGTDFAHDSRTKKLLSLRENGIVYAIALHAHAYFEKSLPRPISPREKLAIGAIFPDVAERIRLEVRSVGLEDDPEETVLKLFVSEIDRGLHPEIIDIFENALRTHASSPDK